MAKRPEDNFLQSLRALSATCELTKQVLVNDATAGNLTKARRREINRQLTVTVGDINILTKLFGW